MPRTWLLDFMSVIIWFYNHLELVGHLHWCQALQLTAKAAFTLLISRNKGSHSRFWFACLHCLPSPKKNYHQPPLLFRFLLLMTAHQQDQQSAEKIPVSTESVPPRSDSAESSLTAKEGCCKQVNSSTALSIIDPIAGEHNHCLIQLLIHSSVL